VFEDHTEVVRLRAAEVGDELDESLAMISRPGIWDVYFTHVRLGQMDERILKIEDALGRRMRNPIV